MILKKMVDKTFLKKIVDYITDFKKESSEFLHFLDKGALLRTDKKGILSKI